MKKLFLLFLVVPFIGCGGSNSGKSTDTSASKPTDTAGHAAAATPSSKWIYDQDTDKMTSKVNYYAMVPSNELLDLKSPYEGENHAKIMVKNSKGANDVELQIDKGQFMAGVDGQNIQARFDDDKSASFHCMGPSDQSTTILFIDPSAKFLAKLKKAKKVTIEVEFYDNGTKDITFDTKDLKWDH